MKTKVTMRESLRTGAAALVLVTAATAATALTVFGAQAQAASGFGVGNGGNSARNAYIMRVKQQMGSPITQRRPSVNQLITWCSRASSVLQQELNNVRFLLMQNRLDQAWQNLMDSMIAIDQTMAVNPELGSPMTKLLISRGVMIARTLEFTPGMRGDRQLPSKLNFLVEYINFVIRMESYIDRPLYIPYRYTYGGCPGGNCGSTFNFAEFQRRYLEYAQQQLRFVTDGLTETVPVMGGMVVRPVGDPKIFLKIAENTSRYVSDDIRSNLHGYAHSCAVGTLLQLAQNLRDYSLFPGGSIYPTSQIAFEEAYGIMSEIAVELEQQPNGC